MVAGDYTLNVAAVTYDGRESVGDRTLSVTAATGVRRRSPGPAPVGGVTLRSCSRHIIPTGRTRSPAPNRRQPVLSRQPLSISYASGRSGSAPRSRTGVIIPTYANDLQADVPLRRCHRPGANSTIWSSAVIASAKIRGLPSPTRPREGIRGCSDLGRGGGRSSPGGPGRPDYGGIIWSTRF